MSFSGMSQKRGIVKSIKALIAGQILLILSAIPVLAETTFFAGADAGGYFDFHAEHLGGMYDGLAATPSSLVCKGSTILVGKPNANGEKGAAELVRDGAERTVTPAVIDEGGFGASVAMLGPVSGYPGESFAIGAPEAGKGSVAIYSASGGTPVYVRSLTPNSSYSSSYEKFGYDIAGIGDLGSKVYGTYSSNPDGSDELLIASPFYSTSSNNTAGKIVITDINNNEDLLHIIGAPYTEFGTAVEVMNLDGDVAPEIVVSAPRDNADYGKVFFFNINRTQTSISATSFDTIVGNLPGYRLGGSIANAGDVDGDNIDDLLIGLEDHMFAAPGKALLLSGATRAQLCVIDSPDIVDSSFGHSFGKAGDLTDDGKAEFIIGGTQSDWGTNFYAGAAYVYTYNASSGSCAPLFRIAGAVSEHEVGSAFGICDLNSDTFLDLLIGTHKYESGSILVYLGHGIIDTCPADPNKFSPGVCGCGVEDVDNYPAPDGNGIIDCLESGDQCPNDPFKSSPGVCGCGQPDDDFLPPPNGNGIIDCTEFGDQCPNDPFKESPGICGCGQPDEDFYPEPFGNGVIDCLDFGDQCPNDPNKVTPGACGCGIPDDDIEPAPFGDGVIDCLANNLCPYDPNKEVPGLCGCGVPDDDFDGDGMPDCMSWDMCPDDPDKTEPGTCGCGYSDNDADNDGIPDCLSNDLCLDDPDKVVPGVCGCGMDDIDIDDDGRAECFSYDQCPDDDKKDFPGMCGCGIPDTDADQDGMPDCFNEDLCLDDKLLPGACGCGLDDGFDQNENGIPDCKEADSCLDDPYKKDIGTCGCGIADIDEDGDGEIDCLADEYDACPKDPDKNLPGICGCGKKETDTDGDSVPDCIDRCPKNADKAFRNVCGCKVPDVDLDGNGKEDCLEDVDPKDLKKIVNPPLDDEDDIKQIEDGDKVNLEINVPDAARPDFSDKVKAKIEKKKLAEQIRFKIVKKKYKAKSEASVSVAKKKKSKNKKSKKKTTSVKISKGNSLTLKKLKAGVYSIRYRTELVKKRKKKKSSSKNRGSSGSSVISKSKYSEPTQVVISPRN